IATGADLDGVEISASDEEIVTILGSPSLSISKEGSYDRVTGEVTYTITVTNDGNIDLEDIVISDSKLSWSETIDVLAVEETQTFTQTYTPDEEEIDAGEVVNIVNVTAPDPNDPDNPIEDEDEETTEVTEKDNPSLSISKEGSYDSATGEVTYTITVINDGNIDLEDITVNDD